MYIDESGDTITLSQKGKKFLVLTGCIIDESDLKPAEETFRSIKKRYYQNPNIEIKSNFLRYANPDITTDSPQTPVSFPKKNWAISIHNTNNSRKCHHMWRHPFK